MRDGRALFASAAGRSPDCAAVKIQAAGALGRDVDDTGNSNPTVAGRLAKIHSALVRHFMRKKARHLGRAL
jgi:hypothetical protein